MQDSEHNTPPAPTDTAAATPGAEAGSIERRRSLLRRLGSGAALVATGAPLQALATGGRKHCFHKDAPSRKCKASVSGMHSAIASAMVNDWPESPGKHCSYYRYTSYWPKDGSNNPYCLGKNGTKYNKNALYRDVFNCAGGGNNDKSLEYIMSNQVMPHCNWVTACLNATKYGSQFSYTAAEVVTLHNDPRRNLDALTFFKYYQENYTS